MKRNRFKLFDGVVALRNICEPELMGAWGRGKPGYVDGKPAVLRGTRGVVVDVVDDSTEVTVEFFDDDGETIDVASVEAEVLRHQTQEEAEQTRAN